MRTSNLMRIAVTICVAASLASSAWAQPPANNNSDKDKPTDKPLERLIYLPFKNLKAVFDKPDGSVLLPYADYIKLWEKAFANGSHPADQPPLNGVITSANYSAKIEKDVARISAAFVIQVLEKGWVEIPVKFGDAAIGAVTSDSGKVLLRGTGTGTYALLLPTPGEHKVSLEITARVRTAPEGKSLDLDIPPVGITNFEILVPEADQTIELKPKLVAQPVESAGKETRIKASIGATEKVSVRWHPRVGTKPDMELLASVNNQTLVSIENGLILTDAWLTYDILRGQLDKIKLVVPKGHRILDITSDAKVKEWKSVEEENRQLVSVEMLSRIDGKMTLEVHTERAMPAEAFDVGGEEGNAAFGIHAVDVVRESGTITVKTGNDLTLTVEDQRGLLRVDEGEVDPKLKRVGAIYYKYYSPSFRLKLSVSPVQPRLVVDHQSQLVFRDDQLQLQAVLTFKVDRAGVFDLKFKIPPNLTIENVLCPQMKNFETSSDKTQLTIFLREKTEQEIRLTVTAMRTLDPAAEKTDQVLPLLEPLNVELENGKVQVYAPAAIDVITETDKLVGVQPDPNPEAKEIANSRLVSSWVYTHRPVEIPVRTVRQPTRLVAVVGTKVDVKQGLVQVTANLNYRIEFAGIDTFRFAVPEAIADKVQITSKASGSAPAIKQKSRAPEAVEGWVTWTVVMQRDVQDGQPFEITYDVEPVKAAEANTEAATVELIKVLDPYDKGTGPQGKRDITVSRIIGELTVVKDRALSVSANASGGDVEQIDVRELEHLPQDGFIGFRYFKQPVKLELTANKYDIQEVVETVVSKALIEIVTDRAGAATYRCRYILKTSERQRLRIDLPANVEVLGVLVDRKLTALEKSGITSEKAWDPYFVNVARTKSSDQPIALSVLFRHVLNPVALQNAGGVLAPKLPIIGGAGNIGTAVQQLQVKIWVPPEYVLVGTPKNFSVQTMTPLRAKLFGAMNTSFGEQNLDAWIGHDTGGVFDFPTEGNAFQYMNLGGARQIEVAWWRMPFYTLIVSGSIVLIALMLRRTSWENKLTVVIIAAFVTCAYALKDYDLVLNGLRAASFGIGALIAIWLIHSVLTPRRVVAGQEKLVPGPELPPSTPQPTGQSPAEPPPATDE